MSVARTESACSPVFGRKLFSYCSRPTWWSLSLPPVPSCSAADCSPIVHPIFVPAEPQPTDSARAVDLPLSMAAVRPRCFRRPELAVIRRFTRECVVAGQAASRAKRFVTIQTLTYRWRIRNSCSQPSLRRARVATILAEAISRSASRTHLAHAEVQGFDLRFAGHHVREGENRTASIYRAATVGDACER